MKTILPVILAVCCLSLRLEAQFADDFSDGNLSGWEGDTSNFRVNAAQQLQLNAPSGTTQSWMYHPVDFSDSMTWSIWLRLDFAPSTSNQLRLYLGLTSPDLASATGYLLEIGATGDQDMLEFKFQENGAITAVAASAPALVATEPVEIHLRITYREGQWTFERYVGTQTELIFSAAHQTVPLTGLSHFGILCRYTETRRDRFYFDDIDISPISPDTTPPLCLDLEATGPHTVQLIFNELLNEATVYDAQHYTLLPGDHHPVSIEYQPPVITLQFADPFISLQPYLLSINGITDLAGNVMEGDIKEFAYVAIESALPGDILITEIMADPTPAVGLPDAEFVEIFNASNKILQLADYEFRAGSTERTLPGGLFYPGEYAIICATAIVDQFEPFGRVIGVGTMPALTNGGATVSISHISGDIIHAVSYTDQWYGDPVKANGGWTLEMINPHALCPLSGNWRASVHPLGGTPAQVNSLWAPEADTDGPILLSVLANDGTVIELRFNEKLDVVLMENPMAYAFQPALDVASVMVTGESTVVLNLATSMQPGIGYILQPFDAYDCQGNHSVITTSYIFGLVESPEPGDVLINEILFNPATGGSRFIEIINVSQKYINLGSLSIGRFTASQQQSFPITIQEALPPGGIAAFTPSPADILSRYTVPHPENLHSATLPSWNDKTDHVALLSGIAFIDSFTYSSTWHHPVIADQNGVSLERVSTQAPSSLASTWHSASGVSGYATPTGPNSQQISGNPTGDKPFTLANKTFSPDGDGFKDFVALHFQLEAGDYTGSVIVYDLEGREIYQIINNESLGTSSIVQWDGRTAEGLPAEMGIYILFIRLWDVQGNVKEYQEACALARR